MKFFTASVAALIAAVPTFVSAANHTVVVGANGLSFEPETTTADVGDFVIFEFRGGNHTVTQSSFAKPCTQQFNTVTNANGFDSAFPGYDPASPTINVYILEITQTASPLWFFCARAPHCTGGMVGAINPPAEGNTFEKFKAAAATAEEPGYGVTEPFTPPAASGSAAPSGVATTGQVPTGSGSDTAAPTATDAGGSASSITVRSGAMLGLLSLVAGLVL